LESLRARSFQASALKPTVTRPVGVPLHSTTGRLMMLAIAQRRSADDAAPDYRLSVAPTVVSAEHPLAHMGLDELGIVYFSDIYGRTTAMSLEDGPVGSAAAMLRDVIEVAARRRHGKPGA